MRRRDFTTGLLLTAAPWAALAQAPARQHRIAVVSPATPASRMTEAGGPSYRGFFQELRRLGFVEGSNLLVERYSAEGHPERYPDLAREVVGRGPDLIIAMSNSLAIAFQKATATIPIVAGMGDPVKSGIVTSLAKPGGNLTGVSVDAGYEIWGKRLQILKELLPSASVVGLLAMRAAWDERTSQQMREFVGSSGISVIGMLLEQSIPSEYQRVFAAAVQDRPDAIAVSPQGDLTPHRQLIVDLAEKSRLPAIYPYRDYVERGGLMAYATDLAEAGRQMAASASQILNGAKPGDIPIHQAIKFEFLINLKTAKALGLTVPPALLARADEVIE